MIPSGIIYLQGGKREKRIGAKTTRKLANLLLGGGGGSGAR
jgi:hypothetical protein